MQYTNETRNDLIDEYSERVGTTKEKTSELFSTGRLIVKYGSNSEPYLVENPDYTDLSGRFIKVRRKNSHLIQKKKKRKK